ncbi:inositol 1,4,5-triphosphate receptor associated 2 isoform X2 [Labrus mixtus]|uniref:inositol 1,4,5-triphosphate receptor associated 2 isoform X2 n=1 Tax=Labrus mixtus TaxID=508554 RepID=UPI0029C0DCAD|nr:inositol 1,4,5-triphosphate receptor associated 2 isoform X2 [Labrus mixtus]
MLTGRHLDYTCEDTMDAQPVAETTSFCASTMLGSEDSDEETSQEEASIIRWNELSIIERVGLNSVEMSEKDLETSFSQIAMAFRCDQYTLKQRLQAEEHARNLAEENVQLELTRGRETLEVLKGLCLDSKRSNILQRLELSLDILGGTVERISNTAEVLGAVHQEARVSRAVEHMVAHVENLRRQHDRNVAELEEAKKTIQQQNSCRNSIDLRPSPDPDECDTRKKSFLQISGRRRVSVSLIPIQFQKIKPKDLKKQASHDGFSPSTKSSPTCRTPSPTAESNCFPTTKDDSNSVEDRPQDPEETPPETLAVQLPPQPSPTPNSECLPSNQSATSKNENKSSPLEPLRQRHKSKAALSKKKVEKDKKSVNIYRQLSGGMYGSLWRQRPLVHWVYRCRWALLFMYLSVLFCVITLTYLLLEVL